MRSIRLYVTALSDLTVDNNLFPVASNVTTSGVVDGSLISSYVVLAYIIMTVSSSMSIILATFSSDVVILVVGGIFPLNGTWRGAIGESCTFAFGFLLRASSWL